MSEQILFGIFEEFKRFVANISSKMGKNRRMPTKKVNKIAKVGKGKKKKSSENRRPNKLSLDDQPLSRKEKEILRLETQAKLQEATQPKRRNRPKNRLVEETMKLGYAQRPWEDTDQLVNRIARDNRTVLEGELIKAKYGAAGRDEKEIAQDYKELDEKRKRKKEQNRNRFEKLRRAEEAKAEARQKQKAARQARKKIASGGASDANCASVDADGNDGSRVMVEGVLDDDGEVSGGGSDDDDGGQFADSTEDDGCQPSGSATRLQKNLKVDKFLKKQSNSDDIQPKRRLGKGDKLRLKRKEIRSTEDKELLLNAREIIPFGECADAPPQFTGSFRKAINEARAQAGKMDLLLKKNLQMVGEKSDKLAGENLAENAPQISLAEERERVIEAYRTRRSKYLTNSTHA